MHREKTEDSKRHNQTIFHCLCLTKWNCTGCIENKWNWTTGHIENLDRNTSTPFDLPLPSSSLQRSIRIGGKKKPQDGKREINIEVHIVLLSNEMKRNVKDDEKNETLNWIRDYTISELLDHWNSGRKLNQYRPPAASFQILSPVTWWFS